MVTLSFQSLLERYVQSDDDIEEYRKLEEDTTLNYTSGVEDGNKGQEAGRLLDESDFSKILKDIEPYEIVETSRN
jgi:hypothetical protein